MIDGLWGFGNWEVGDWVLRGCGLVGLKGCSGRRGNESGHDGGRWDSGWRAELILCLESF
jgi:hypothetical protein